MTYKGREVKQADIDRFHSKIAKSDGCWEWLAYKTNRGYGIMGFGKGRTVKAHRFSYILAHGHIDEGMDIDHLCRNTSCVNPAHLEAVVHRENVLRGLAGAHNVEKTHCPAGHEYDEQNTYIHRGKRSCKACKNASALAYHKSHQAHYNELQNAKRAKDREGYNAYMKEYHRRRRAAAKAKQ